ncbi:MAG: site-2 protease family protein, partial [Oscillospiraceae bacterium]|nr:site-2 protease family protein [Oscillospiraceae bacterium]
VNIGVMNLFPIAPLDGSLFVFLLIEAIIRRPVPEKLRTVVQIIGIVMILALFVFVTYSDIARLITG